MNTEPTNRPELLARLKEIREYVARCRASGRVEPGMPDAFGLENGICDNLNGAYTGARNWLKETFARWPKFSGNVKYPVPGEEPDPQAIFECAYPQKWIGSTYADNRFELLEFLIAELEKSAPALTAHPHAKLMALYAQDAARTPNPGRLWQWRAAPTDSWATDDPRIAVDGMFFYADVEYRRHPHADSMLEWEKDQRENPGQVWQCRSVTAGTPWRDMIAPPRWQEGMQYRQKPKVRRIGAYEYPEPESKAPADEAEYWIPSTASEESAIAYTWRNDEPDFRWLARGLVHLTKEAAEAHCEAMLKGWTA